MDEIVSALMSGRDFQTFSVPQDAKEPLELIPALQGKPLALYRRYSNTSLNLFTIVTRNPPLDENGALELKNLHPEGEFFLIVLDGETAGIDRFVFDLRVLVPEIRDTAVTPTPSEATQKYYHLPGEPLLSQRRLTPPSAIQPEPVQQPVQSESVDEASSSPEALPEASAAAEPTASQPAPQPIPPDAVSAVQTAAAPVYNVWIVRTFSVLLLLAVAAAAGLALRARKVKRQVNQLTLANRTEREELGMARQALSEKSAALQTASAHLMEQEQRYGEFVRELTNELRVPISTIKGYADILSGELICDEQLKTTYLRKIYDKSEEVSVLFSNLISSTRISEDDFLREQLGLRELLSEIVTDYQPICLDHQIQLFYSPCPQEIWISADRPALTQAVHAVLQNALKNMGRSGTITLTLAQACDDALIIVRDDGVGMSSALAEALFTQLVREDTGAAETMNGLWQRLVQRTVSLHSGRAWAKSTPDRGLAVYILLPLGARNPPPVDLLPPLKYAAVPDGDDSRIDLKEPAYAANHNMKKR